MMRQTSVDLDAEWNSGPVEVIHYGEHRIRVRPTRAGWMSFVTRPGHRPVILIATDCDTLIAEAKKVIDRQAVGEG